ncbi:ATP-binding protein [Streptomyces sp. NPDC051051]|uniref:ATP-binding protein n=1 Tax=Streptomyces sp. NPDC051051 TaxID=3155666 RepID=UPI00343F02DD
MTCEVKRQAQVKRKPQITAVAELVWNALDDSATEVDVELRRSSMKAITDVVVTDNGHSMTPERARTAFQAYGTTWKTSRTHTEGGERILHGRNGEGRLFAFALGDQLTWESAAVVDRSVTVGSLVWFDPRGCPDRVLHRHGGAASGGFTRPPDALGPNEAPGCRVR